MRGSWRNEVVGLGVYECLYRHSSFNPYRGGKPVASSLADAVESQIHKWVESDDDLLTKQF